MRPGDFARVLLAASAEPPRARARDGRADVLGESLKRSVLNRLVALDPEPESIESALVTIITEIGEPSGPTRAVCTAIVQEWNMARLNSSLWPFLISQAVEAAERNTAPRRPK
jgi:hypothetical protein